MSKGGGLPLQKLVSVRESQSLWTALEKNATGADTVGDLIAEGEDWQRTLQRKYKVHARETFLAGDRGNYGESLNSTA